MFSCRFYVFAFPKGILFLFLARYTNIEEFALHSIREIASEVNSLK